MALALGVGYGLSVPMYADLVVLRSGDRLEGNVTGQTISAVNFVGDDGRVQLLPKSSIATIFYFSTAQKDRQEAKLAVLQKEEQAEKRREELKKKREEARERREKELKEKRERERKEALEKKREEQEELREELKKEQEEQRREEQEAREERLDQEKERQREQERRRQEALRLERTEGLVRLWSGQEISARILEKRGEIFTLETPAGFMEFHRSEIEQMEYVSSVDGANETKIIGPDKLEAVNSVEPQSDRMDLSSGMTVTYKTVEFDGYNTEMESEAGTLQLRPEDGEYTSSSKPLSGMDLAVGQYGFVMLRSGQQLNGDLMLRSKYEWVLDTDQGRIHLNTDDIVFARAQDRPSSWGMDSLMFWR